MKKSTQPAPEPQMLNETEWHSLRDLIHRVTGIALSPAKKPLLVSRLTRRLKVHRFATFTEYYEHVVNADPAGDELQALVNAITTNKTEFFREPHHFEFLEKWLQSDEADVKMARQRGVRIWCSAASTGEEVYTIAAVVRAALSQSEWASARIYGTDLDTNALRVAGEGRYLASEVEDIPEFWRTRMFTRSRHMDANDVIVRPELRAQVQLGQLNLTKDGWGIPRPLDAVFCRNVLIYFDKATQQDVVRRACALLAPHGLLFLGHSEGLTGLELHLESVGQTTYRISKDGKKPSLNSVPRLRAVSLSDAAPSRALPFVIGAQGKIRISPRRGVLLTLFNALAAKTCAAYLTQDTDCADELRLQSILQSMLRAVRQAGESSSAIQAKTVAASDYSLGTDEQLAGLQARVHSWLERSGIELAATRGVTGDAELTVDLATGRIVIRTSAQSSSGRSLSARRASRSSSGPGGSV